MKADVTLVTADIDMDMIGSDVQLQYLCVIASCRFPR